MLDHGVLNVPLAKRGNIDAQIDKWKADQAKAAKAKAKDAAIHKAALRVQADAVLASMSQEQLARIAAKSKLTVAQARKKLQSIAYWTPAQVIALGAAA